MDSCFTMLLAFLLECGGSPPLFRHSQLLLGSLPTYDRCE
jgi:hypothetical protein